MPSGENKKASYKQIFSLLKDYFVNSDEKLYAWLMLGGAVLCVTALVGLMAFLTIWWMPAFWAVLTAKALVPFLYSIGQIGAIVSAMVGVNVLKTYLLGKLTISWRNWLTNKFIKELFQNNEFLELNRIRSTIDNVSQRVQEDVGNIVNLVLDLGEKFLKSTLSLVSFTGTLWALGGTLSFVVLGLNVVIPGFLVWAALFVSVAATVATYFLGKSLSKNAQAVASSEANLRSNLNTLNHEAENIAEEHAQSFHLNHLSQSRSQIIAASSQNLNAQTRLTAFQSFYYNLTHFIPFIAAAPLYFAGMFNIGQLMQIGQCFGQVSMAMSMVVQAYSDISVCRASLDRAIELQSGFSHGGGQALSSKLIERKERSKPSINIKNLTIQRPLASSSDILRGLNVKLQHGVHVLIQGASGLGKSTLFKIISGSWAYGMGKVSLPNADHAHMQFLPQTPTIPKGSLRSVLSYPDPEASYSDAEYYRALNIVGGLDAFKDQLGTQQDWSHLSGGQKQRVSFVRALLRKPDWLFLDEATSGLDSESEARCYQAIKDHLPGTTMVSIGHRDTISSYHDRILHFGLKKDNPEGREIVVEERFAKVSASL